MPKAKNIPIARGTVVHLRDSNGRVMPTKGIVMRNQKPSAFSRAYGRQVMVCVIGKGTMGIHHKGAGDLFPVGKVKRIPKVCTRALKLEKVYNPTLFGAKTRKRGR